MIKKIFSDGGIAVNVETFIVDGKKRKYISMVQPDGIVIFAISNDKILVEKHYRRAIRTHVFELPAGHINNGEKPIDAAKRELIEETGYEPTKIKYLFKAKEAQPKLNNMLYFYLAENLVKRKKHEDKGEIITTKWIKKERFESIIKNSKIVDMKTIAAYTYYKTYVNKK